MPTYLLASVGHFSSRLIVLPEQYQKKCLSLAIDYLPPYLQGTYQYHNSPSKVIYYIALS